MRIPTLLVRSRQTLQSVPHRPVADPDGAAVPPHLALIMLFVGGRPLRRNGIGVFEDEDILVLAEEAVEVFEAAAGRFGIEEVDGGYKGEVEDGPDDVEPPMERLDTNRGDLNNCCGL